MSHCYQLVSIRKNRRINDCTQIKWPMYWQNNGIIVADEWTIESKLGSFLILPPLQVSQFDHLKMY